MDYIKSNNNNTYCTVRSWQPGYLNPGSGEGRLEGHCHAFIGPTPGRQCSAYVVVCNIESPSTRAGSNGRALPTRCCCVTICPGTVWFETRSQTTF